MKIDEYIKREDALSLKKPFPNQKGMITLYRQYFIDPEAVEQLPAADVRPVVLCKDCKYFHKESGKCLNIDGMAKQLTAIDFCSCGEEVDDG